MVSSAFRLDSQIHVAVWRMQMAELSKAIKETRRARRRPLKRDLKSFSSFMTRSTWHNKPIYGNMHEAYMVDVYNLYIRHIHNTPKSYREARLEIVFWFAIKKDGFTSRQVERDREGEELIASSLYEKLEMQSMKI